MTISLPFFVLAAAIAWARRNARPRQARVTAIVAGVLFALTIVFDNLMIWAGLVGYSDSHRLGIDIGLIPAEDLLYPLVAALIIPAVWPGKGTKR
ncbi:lycopene cyclase domain-containing protein [Corynebacterium sp.]|uniref:lycopene cyclase domain-containing protein n=1 Tax=Corynebacterium sp. TaxID=1720 RepID=UPI003B3A471F